MLRFFFFNHGFMIKLELVCMSGDFCVVLSTIIR